MKKRTIFLVGILLCIALSAGCRKADPQRNNFDTVMFYANIKTDARSQHGKKAVCYDGRIYYLGAETGTQGVYSMAGDGSDVRLEFPVEDIRALWVGPEGYLYSGYSGMSENFNGPYRCFNLYSKATSEAEPEDMFHVLCEQTYSSHWQSTYAEYASCVWDFYCADDGTVYVCIYFLAWAGYPRADYVAISDGKPVSEFEYTQLAQHNLAINKRWTGCLTLSVRGDIYIQRPLSTPFSIYDGTPSVQRLVLAPGRILNYKDSNIRKCFDAWLCAVDGTQALLAGQNGVALHDWETEETRLLAAFQKNESIYAAYMRDNDMLLLTEQTPYLFMNQFVQETLYALNTETGKRERLLRLPIGAAFVHVDDERAVAANEKQLLIYDITGPKAALLETKPTEHEVVRKENKVDVAGGWLFLYGYDQSAGRDELLEKVRLDKK